MQVPITYYDDAFRPDPAGLNYRGVLPLENGADSGVIAQCYLRWQGGPWGGGTFRGVALEAGTLGGIGEVKKPLNAPYGEDFWTIPDGHPADPVKRPTRSIYVEGRRDHPGVPVSVHVLPLAQ